MNRRDFDHFALFNCFHLFQLFGTNFRPTQTPRTPALGHAEKINGHVRITGASCPVTGLPRGYSQKLEAYGPSGALIQAERDTYLTLRLG
jgi:hypothetical protein